jgi:hypothetical protein
MYIPLIAGLVAVVVLTLLIGWWVTPPRGDADRH